MLHRSFIYTLYQQCMAMKLCVTNNHDNFTSLWDTSVIIACESTCGQVWVGGIFLDLSSSMSGGLRCGSTQYHLLSSSRLAQVCAQGSGRVPGEREQVLRVPRERASTQSFLMPRLRIFTMLLLLFKASQQVSPDSRGG